MPSKAKRSRTNRRERRKARASGWQRTPKKMGAVGHGSNMTIGHIGHTEVMAKKEHRLGSNIVRTKKRRVRLVKLLELCPELEGIKEDVDWWYTLEEIREYEEG